MCGLAFVLLLAACAPPPVRAAPTPFAPAALDAAVLADPVALVAAERSAAAARDLPALAALWAEDAEIVERRAAGDYRWRGRAAILDRYAVAVFAAPPPPLAAPIAAAAVIDGARATLQNGVDTWHFAQRDGRWWITALEIGG